MSVAVLSHPRLSGAQIPEVSVLIERAREIGRMARECAQETERNRQVSSDLVQTMREADLFRIMQPKA